MWKNKSGGNHTWIWLSFPWWGKRSPKPSGPLQMTSEFQAEIQSKLLSLHWKTRGWAEKKRLTHSVLSAMLTTSINSPHHLLSALRSLFSHGSTSTHGSFGELYQGIDPIEKIMGREGRRRMKIYTNSLFFNLFQYNSSSAVTKDPAKMWKRRAGWRKDLRGLTSQCHWQEDTWFQFKILSTSSKHLTSLLCFQDTNSKLRGLTEWNNVSLWRYQHDKSSVVLIIYICCSL